MNSIRALSLGGAAALVLTSWAAIAARVDDEMRLSATAVQADIIRVAEAAVGEGVTSYYGTEAPDGTPAWAADATINPDYAAGETKAAPADAADEAVGDTQTTAVAEEAPTAPASGDGVTSYFGTEKAEGAPPWSAEAKINPDYSSAPAAAAEVAPEPTGGDGVTSYFGIGEAAAAAPAWAAEAAMNPDYSTAAAAPAGETPAADADVATEEAPPQPTGGDGVTSFYGEEKLAGTPAWAAAATMNPDYSAPSAAMPAAVTDVASDEAKACSAALGANSGKIVFGQSSFSVARSSYGTLDSIAKIVNGCGNVVVEVAGHTDNTGRSASNAKLSELRANAVVKYLTRAGVDAGKLKAVGYGPDKPAASNDTADGRRQNRRIDFTVK